jgi:gliding motility-associated-like protein
VFTTVDDDDSAFEYALVSGDGDYNNPLFKIENDQLFLLSSQISSEPNAFSIRVKSTDSHAHSIEKTFLLQKLEVKRKDLRIPTTFSPDGDGINDTWVVKDLKQFKEVSIQVFDRSGVPLFTSTDPEHGWDGSASGGKILEGPFFYIIKIHDTLAVKKGVLVVIR